MMETETLKNIPELGFNMAFDMLRSYSKIYLLLNDQKVNQHNRKALHALYTFYSVSC